MRSPQDEGEGFLLFGVAVSALIRALGYASENYQRALNRESAAYYEGSFSALAEEIENWDRDQYSELQEDT